MYVRNTPYDRINRGSDIVKKSELKSSPTIFDYINGDVEVVNGELEVKKVSDKILYNAKDAVVISEETLKKARNEYIEKSLESGEPMKGISYNDFVEFYREKDGYYREEDFMKQLYYQAQKGWKASCAEREWRTNPNFILSIPWFKFDSPELAEDREAAFEKLKNGGELTQIEKDLLDTFSDLDVRCKRVNEVIQELGKKRIQQRMLDKMSAAELSPYDEITFTVWGYKIIDVQGKLSNEKLAAIKESMTDEASHLYMIYQNSPAMRAMSKGTGYQFGQFIKAQQYLELAGGGSLLELSKDRNGDYHGIPEKLDKFLKENKHYRGDDEARLQAMWVEHAFDEAIAAVKAGRYEWFMSKVGTVTYKNGEFFA